MPSSPPAARPSTLHDAVHVGVVGGGLAGLISALGLALALPTTRHRSEAAALSPDELLPKREMLFRAVIGILLGFLARILAKLVPLDNMNLFYGLEFAISAAYTFSAVVYVPVGSNLLFGRKIPDLQPETPRKKKKKQ